jgi:cyclopropane fatty-acyl-phospholipid synthase-like methyltransferase
MSHSRPSGQEEQTLRNRPDFGVYHYTQRVASEKIRAAVENLFTHAFASLPFRTGDKLKILDVGCGLGFLSCVSAEFYNNARITGIDTFKHASLKGSSLEKVKENAEILGLSDRTDFIKVDVFKFAPTRKFDLIVSNLAFHNFGKRRLDAYELVARWSKRKSYIILGDLFFDYEVDLMSLSKLFNTVKERQ